MRLQALQDLYRRSRLQAPESLSVGVVHAGLRWHLTTDCPFPDHAIEQLPFWKGEAEEGAIPSHVEFEQACAELDHEQFNSPLDTMGVLRMLALLCAFF